MTTVHSSCSPIATHKPLPGCKQTPAFNCKVRFLTWAPHQLTMHNSPCMKKPHTCAGSTPRSSLKKNDRAKRDKPKMPCTKYTAGTGQPGRQNSVCMERSCWAVVVTPYTLYTASPTHACTSQIPNHQAGGSGIHPD